MKLKENKAPLVCDARQTLVEKTWQLLDKRVRPDHRTCDLMELFREHGIPFYWLEQFHRKKVNKPGANRIQYLYEKLSGKKLL